VSFELDLPRELDSAAAARHAVDELADRLPADQIGDVRLLVSELVTNSLRHAELRPDDRIRLGVDVSDEMVRVEVTDSGKGFEFEGPADDPATVEGWGLYLVATLSDRWGITRDPKRGTSVWFELDRAPGQADQAGQAA
jgi:anti-sigma regulatory factor (Ser/Thr protein kinase)